MHKKPISRRKKAEMARREKTRKTRMWIVLSLTAVLVTMAVVIIAMNRDGISDLWSHRGLVPLTEAADGSLSNEKKGLRFLPADGCYEPTETGSAFAYLKNRSDTRLFEVTGQKTSLWLSGENIGTGTLLYHADTIRLPALSEMDPNVLRICDSSKALTLEIHRLTDKALIGEIVRLFTEGDDTDIPFPKYTVRLDLKFCSNDWPMLYYNLTYLQCPEGGYVYDRYSLRCVFIGDLLTAYADI